MVSSEEYDGLYLSHHGIKGQHWGKRNGPPYPLSDAKHNKVVKSGDDQWKKLSQERNKHKPYTKQEKFILRARVLNNPFDKLYWTEKSIQNKQKKYIKERNKNAELDKKSNLYKKRKNTSIDEDLDIINMKKGSKGSGAHNNCVLCSIAYELRRRGFDVLANDAIVGYSTEEYTKAFKGMKTFSNVTRLKEKTNKETGLKETTLIDVNKYISSIMKDYKTMPNKSRGMMVVKWGHPQDMRYTIGGHAIAWEVIDGKFTVLDCQTGKKYPSGPELSGLLARTNKAEMYRLDNLEPNFEYIQEMGLVKKNVIGGAVNVK